MADEEQLIDQEEEETAAPSEAALPFTDDSLELDDDFEETTLTFMQKVWIGVAVAASFLVFSVIFFPLDLVIRQKLQNPQTGLTVDFTSLDLNPFGADSIADLDLRAGGMALTSKEVLSHISWMGVLSRDLKGSILLQQTFTLQAGGLSIVGNQAKVDIDIDDVLRTEPRTWRGDFALELKDVGFRSLPSGIPLPIAPEQLKVPMAIIKANFNQGQLLLDGSRIDTNLFNITISGTGAIRGDLSSMQLDSRLCLRPVSDLQQKNETIYGFYVAMGGAGGGELCFKLQGNLANPRFIPENAPPSGQEATEPGAKEEPAPATSKPNEEGNPDTGEQESSEEL